MVDNCKLTFQQQSIVQQGYANYSPQELKQLEWGLRFTPLACSLITLYGLVFWHPYVLFGVAVLGMWAFFFPAAHPMDLFYNHLVRPLFGAAKIPPNPLQRRLACLSAAMINIATGVLMLLNLATPAYIFGGLLLVLQAIVICTHFCVLSWVYELLANLMGKWNLPVEQQQAKSLLAKGATLIDVRSPQEYAQEHLPGAVNIPLETLPEKLSDLPEGPVLLHCKSGMRSNVATGILKKNKVAKVYNVGSYQRAKQILELA